MTPSDIETAARRAYNAVGDTYWSEAEIMSLIYFAQMALVEAGLVIERTYSTSTVANQLEYDYPSQLTIIKRVEYNGAKLTPIDFREDDMLTLSNSTTTDSGTPAYYYIWNETLHLRPLPSAVGTLKIFGYAEPQTITITSTLEVPTFFHPAIVDYVVKEMVIKDSNFNAYDRYNQRWEMALMKAKKYNARKKRGDGFAVVKNEDLTAVTLLGRI